MHPNNYLFSLVAKSSIKVNGVDTPKYRYETTDGKIIVEFHAGPIAWTYALGLATNAEGHKMGFELISAFLRQALHSLKNTPGADQDEAIRVVHVTY